MLLVFGIAFEIPRVRGAAQPRRRRVRARRWARYRPWIIIGIFVFAAVATPSTDPFSMLLLAVPMVMLFFVSEVDRAHHRPAPRPAPTAAEQWTLTTRSRPL